MPIFQPQPGDPEPQPGPRPAGAVVIDASGDLLIDGTRFPWNLVAIDVQNASTRPVLILTMHCDNLEIQPRRKPS